MRALCSYGADKKGNNPDVCLEEGEESSESGRRSKNRKYEVKECSRRDGRSLVPGSIIYFIIAQLTALTKRGFPIEFSPFLCPLLSPSGSLRLGASAPGIGNSGVEINNQQ